MGEKLSAAEGTLYRRVDEALHYLWDPIGVSWCPDARDEYDGYVPQLFSMLVNRADTQEVIDFLVRIETVMMGRSTTQQAGERARKIAMLLEDYRKIILV